VVVKEEVKQEAEPAVKMELKQEATLEVKGEPPSPPRDQLPTRRPMKKARIETSPYHHRRSLGGPRSSSLRLPAP
jgi:hypothetical protein